MKSTICASIFLFVVLSIALPSLSFAGADGPSATGSFQFSVDDGQPNYLDFNARQQNNGRTVGEMTFTDPSATVVPGWTPKDSERDDDISATLSWLATDAERSDDVGVPSNQSKIIGCQSFPLSSYVY